MDYNNINMPDIYDNYESFNNKKNIKFLQSKIKANDMITENSICMLLKEKYGCIIDSVSIIYIITNNTKLYLFFGSKFIKIYNKMFYMFDGHKIKNLSDEDAIINIYIIDYLGCSCENIIFNDFNLNININKLNRKFFEIDSFSIKIVENIFIKTKQDIKNKFIYVGNSEIEFCYKINNVEKNNYILNLYKITNKINKKELNILYSNKTLENIIHYYENLVLEITKIFENNVDYFNINYDDILKVFLKNYCIYYEIIRIQKNIKIN